MWGFIVKLGGSNIAIVEYLGVPSGLGPHGNSKRKGDYMRTSSTAMQETSELLQKHKPLDVFNKLRNKHDELWVMDKATCSRFMTKSKMTKTRQLDAMTLDRPSAEKNKAVHIALVT